MIFERVIRLTITNSGFLVLKISSPALMSPVTNNPRPFIFNALLGLSDFFRTSGTFALVREGTAVGGAILDLRVAGPAGRLTRPGNRLAITLISGSAGIETSRRR